jgi:hypothetical protein
MMSKPRTLTDLVGPYYTLVMETTAKDLGAWDSGVAQTLVLGAGFWVLG